MGMITTVPEGTAREHGAVHVYSDINPGRYYYIHEATPSSRFRFRPGSEEVCVCVLVCVCEVVLAHRIRQPSACPSDARLKGSIPIQYSRVGGEERRGGREGRQERAFEYSSTGNKGQRVLCVCVWGEGYRYVGSDELTQQSGGHRLQLRRWSGSPARVTAHLVT